MRKKTTKASSNKKYRPLGYAALTRHFHLQVIPHFFHSVTNDFAKKKTILREDEELRIYPKVGISKDPMQDLLFAVRYEGINLGILKALFKRIPSTKIEELVQKNKFNNTARKIWYLYELLTGNTCKLESRTGGRYCELLDSKKYYTCHAENSTRHRVKDNLLGNAAFCPFIRRTDAMRDYERKTLLQNAASFLRHRKQKAILPVPAIDKMTKLDVERTSKKRYTRFVKLIKEASDLHELTKDTLIKVHNRTMGKGLFEYDFRKHQNYLAYDDDKHHIQICRISPKPTDVNDLICGLLASYHRMKKSHLHPVLLAAVLSFGFSIIHPFGDGNGRIQLFLLYFALLHSNFQKIAHSVAPSLLQLFYQPTFNLSVTHFDRALTPLIKYKMHKDESLTVYGETGDYYRYIDFTPMVEFLFSFVEKEVERVD